VKRFADAGVLAAVADRAVATTLVTTEGRALTEIVLTVQNRAQPFLKVTLPAGASIVSVDVAGEAAKPVLGADGTRVPLLRPGFRPSGSYAVTFVYLHAGTPFARKGEMQMTLPRMDIPVGIVEWEVFVPDNYSVRASDGNVIDRRSIARAASASRGGKDDRSGFGSGSAIGPGSGGGSGGGGYRPAAPKPLPGQISGRVADPNGGILSGVTIVLEAGRSRQIATTGPDGTFLLSAVPSGPVTVTAQLPGMTSETRSFAFDQQPLQMDFTMPVGVAAETVNVAGGRELDRSKSRDAPPPPAMPSQNVINLQRRAAGVLPVRIDVPRAGTSHQFVKPLVVDQEATVMFRYKRR
jgi:hypothetical protein